MSSGAASRCWPGAVYIYAAGSALRIASGWCSPVTRVHARSWGGMQAVAQQLQRQQAPLSTVRLARNAQAAAAAAEAAVTAVELQHDEQQPNQVQRPAKQRGRITCTSSLAPTDAHRRRMALAKRHGSGRSTTLRNFTLQLSLPAPPSPIPPSPAARQPSSKTPPLTRSEGSLSGATPGSFVFTPMEGVPERQVPNKRPRHATPAPPPAAAPASPSVLAFTPMEGVPERAPRCARTCRRPAIASHAAGQLAGEADFLHRAHDSVCKSALPSPKAQAAPSPRQLPAGSPVAALPLITLTPPAGGLQGVHHTRPSTTSLWAVHWQACFCAPDPAPGLMPATTGVCCCCCC